MTDTQKRLINFVERHDVGQNGCDKYPPFIVAETCGDEQLTVRTTVCNPDLLIEIETQTIDATWVAVLDWLGY